MNDKITIVECPRDAMQGMNEFIPTADKIKLINSLAATGFPVVDFGSFVSPKAMPQMADTGAVLNGLENNNSSLLVIVANERGAREAVEESRIAIVGYPLSVSETFQKRNSNKTIVESLEELVTIQQLCQERKKELVVYLSMAFGNPYNDPYSIDIVKQFAGVLISIGVKTIAISDTVGLATPEEVEELYRSLSEESVDVTWGLHLHARPEQAEEKVKAAITAGCRRIDGAVLGYGGCPMAKDELVGNINTRLIIHVAEEFGLDHGLDLQQFEQAEKIAQTTFRAN